MTLTDILKALPGVQIIGISAILNGKYIGYSRMDSVDLTDYGREVLEAPAEVAAEDLPVLEVPVKGKGKKSKEDPSSLDLGE